MVKKQIEVAKKPEIVRDKKGRILKGIAQDTNKNGKAGAPTKYKPKYCEDIITYFDKKELFTDIVVRESESGATYKRWPVGFPSLDGFARQLKVDTNTVTDWAKLHPEFFRAVMQAKTIQKDILMQLTLSGLYNAGFAQFMAINLWPEVFKKTEAKDPDGPTNKDPSEMTIEEKQKRLAELKKLEEDLTAPKDTKTP